MYEEIRDFAPTLLIPAAWILAYGAIEGYFTSQSAQIAHIVMVFFISFFIITGYKDMLDGALRGWLTVLIVGLLITFVGTLGFYIDSYGDIPYVISLWGWMIIPSLGLFYTGMKTGDPIYYVSAILSLSGAVSYPFIDIIFVLTAVCVGQTIGIIKAVIDDKGGMDLSITD